MLYSRLRRRRSFIRGMRTPCTCYQGLAIATKSVLHSCLFLLRAPEPAHWPKETCFIFLGPVYLEELLITKINQMPKVIMSVNKVLTKFILEIHNHLKSRNYFLQVMSWDFLPHNWQFFFNACCHQATKKAWCNNHAATKYETQLRLKLTGE